MGHVLIFLHKSVVFKLVAVLLLLTTGALLFQLSTTFKVHALNVHTEIKADPPGIVRIIDQNGEPPPGIVNSEGNGPTAPTTDPNADSGQPGEPESDPPPASDPPPGIGKIITESGAPPAGLVRPKGNRPTILTINTDIEFGTVFPGETQQGEFIIYITDAQDSPATVLYHLILSTPGATQDLSPYLNIVRDSAETGEAPDTPVSASLTDQDDISDRWLVTLTLPDDPPEGDYGITITVWVDSSQP